MTDNDNLITIFQTLRILNLFSYENLRENEWFIGAYFP